MANTSNYKKKQEESEKKIQAALETRRKRKDESSASDKSNASDSKIKKALNSRNERVKSSMPDILSNIQELFNTELDAYKNTTPSYGMYDETYNSQRERRLGISELRSKVNAYRKYLGSSSANDILSTLDQMEQGYDSYLSLSKFESEDAYKAAVKNWEDYYNNWGHYADAEDFNEYSDIGTTINYTDFGSETRHRGKSRRQRSYTTIDDYRAAAIALTEHNGGEVDSNDTAKYSDLINIYRNMKDDEFQLLSYFLAKDKAEGTNLAEQYVDAMGDTLRNRRGKEIASDLDDINIPIIEDIAKLATGWAGGFINSYEGIIQYVTGENLPTDVSQYANMYIADSLDGFAGYAHEAATTIGNMTPSILVGSALGPAAGAATMGVSVAGNAYAQALDWGYDKTQARVYGTIIGALEGGLQYAIGGISKLSGLKLDGKIVSKIAAIDKMALRIAAKLGWENIKEIGEEELQNYLEPLVRTIVLGEEYDAPTATELLETAIVTFLSTSALEGSGVVINDVHETRRYTDIGKSVMGTEGGFDALQDIAYDVANKSDVNMQKIINKQAGNVTSEVATGKNIVGKAVAAVKNASNATKVGRLYNTVQTANNLNNATANQADIAKSLQRKGFNAETANDIAEALVASYNGQELTKAQEKLLKSAKDSKVVQDAISNIMNNEQSTMGQRSQNIRDFQQDVATGRIAKALGVSKETVKEMYEGKDTTSTETAPESSYEVSVDGKTIDSNGNDIVITGAESIEDGKMILKTESGTIDASEVQYASEADAFVYEAVARMGASPASAWTMIKAFNEADGITAKEYATAAPLAYLYGKLGYKNGVFADGKPRLSLTDTQSATIYQMGRADAEASVKATTQASTESTISEKNAGKEIIFEGFTYSKRKANPVQRASMEAIDVISKMSSLEIHVYKSYKKDGKLYAVVNGKERLAPNGYYTDGSKVYVDINAGNMGEGLMLYTLSHEIGHHIARYDAQDFKAISDFLFEHYGEDVPVYDLLEAQKRKLKKSYEADGKPIPSEAQLEKEAHEELVCDMLSRMLADKNAYDKLMELKQNDLNAFQKLGQAIKKALDKLAKILGIYDKLTPGFMYAASKDNIGEEAFRQLQDLYIKAFVQADANYKASIGGVEISNQITMEEDVIDSSNTGIAKEAKAGIRMQERTEFEAQPKQVFRVSTVNGKAESNMLGTKEKPLLKSVKELRDANFKENGFSKEEIDKINGFIKEMADNMAKYRLKYKFIGLQNIHDAKIILDPMSGKIVLSAMVNNSDYSVNFDFTKICKKRVALQEVLETLAREKGKVTDGNVTEVNLTPANIKHINDILASYGVETACLCCFVESKRYNIQNYYQEKVVDVWNALVDEVAPDAGYFNFADSDVDTSKIPDSEFAALEKQMNDWGKKTGKAKDVEQKMREFLADAPAARKKLRFSDLVTANGRTNLHKLYPEIESLILSKLGQSAPKSVEAFTPYNGEIDLLEATNNGDIIKYLYSIAGVRSQSFSDFMIAHVFDVLQKTASMSARKMPAHVYTKEIARAMLFGMTGEKHNMSVLHNVDPNVDSWSAGLSADGEYNFSDYEAYKKGYSEFVQSIGWKDAVTLQNTEGYSKDCGIIGVGFSYNHMLKLHNDPEVRQVIGYHTSQMPVEVKPLTHLDKAADYTGVQNTKAFAGFAKPNYAIPEGVPSYATPPQDIMPKGDKKKTPKTTAVSDTFDIVGTFNKLSKGKTGDARTAAAKETLRQLLEYANDHGYVIKTASGEKGKGEFDLYGDVQKTQNPYLTTDHYIEYCIERGFLPMFFEFSMNPNYYKDIFDFNVFDRKSYNPETGLHEDSEGRKAYAPQTAVHMLNEDGSLAFPENFFDIVDKQMNSYNSYMQDVDSKMPSIMDEVRAVTNSTTKMSERNFKNDQNAKGEFVANILIDLGDMNSKWWTGKYNHAIFGMSKTDDTEFRQFYQELLKRTKDMDDYGEGDNQIVFDAFKVQDGKGNEFIYRVALDGYLHGVVVAKINLARYKAYVKKYGRSNNHGRTPANTIRRVGTARANLGSNGSGSIGSKQPNGNSGPSGVVGASPQGNITGNDSGGNSPNPKVPDVTSHDSDGNQLSAEQQKFFKRSVVRDADGRLMVMYHGTANGGAFTIFEGDKLGNRTLTSQIGQGFYFTNVKKEAESYMKNVDIYGRVSNGKSPYLHQVYLNITNPFDVNADTLDIDKVKSVYMDGTSDHFFDSYISHYLNNKTVNGRVFTKAEVQGMSKADRVSLYVDYLAQIGTKELLSNMVQAFKFNEQSQLLASMKNRLGYDGIVEEFKPGQFQYVAFSSEQIKNVDNQNPTTDPDIRYSDRVLMGSLFSGGGTLEAGLAYQMLDKQFGVEYDGKIASVYADNHGDHIQVGRVEDFDISKYDDIFYLHASPVCHNFSAAKHGARELAMDIASARATAKHLETAMPQVFTVENALGYLKSQSLKIITDKLTELGYKWDVDIYNSADYGSATSRNRVILRAVKDGELPAKPTKQDRTNSWDKVTRDLWDTLPKATLRPSFISAIENTRNLPILDANGKVNVNKPLLILTTTSGHTVTYCWEGDICPTLTTKCGEARLVMPDGNIYAVTPEFMGRIQGLPNDYKYPKEKTRAFTIIGNGIPTHLTKAVVGGVLDSAYEQTHDGQVLYQDRDTDSISNRSLLANAFEGLAKDDTEKNKIREYKEKIALINEEERKLSELNAQIKELSFSQGPRDTKKIRSLQFEANQAANRINTYDKQLLRLEASKPLQDVLAREKKKAYQKAEKRGKDALAAYKEKTAKTQRELLERWQDSRKKGIENREKTAMRHKIQSVVGELNQLLLSNDKKRHVPDSLKKAVADALALVNMDTVGAEERAAKYAALIAKESDPDKIDAYTVTMENILRQGDKMGQRLKELRDAYEEIQNSDDPDIANAYDPVIAGALKELAGSIGDTSLRDMSIEQLQDVYSMYKMVLTRVRDANKSFIKGRAETISNLASRVVGEVKRVGGEHKYRAAILDFVKKFGWDNMKPVYAFEHIGSGTLTDVFNSVRAGEDVWAVDVTEAREYYLDKSKKYGYDSWDFKKKYSFKSASELDFELTLEQILSLYAYSKREQAHDHLRLGGFVFDSNIETYKENGSKLIKYKVNTADAHQITPEILANIIGNLTEEQRSFVDEMQDYLSTVMGAKGNEVTMAMYGVKLFKEKFYFPLKSAKQFMFEQNEVSGEVRIKNSGFTNKVVAKANNPVILNNFMDVWANHVNDMSMYHAFVLPLEDFNRVFNYNSPKQEGQPPVSVKGTIQNAYGPSAVGYVRQLITDLNGGARSDSTTGIINKLIGLFKKGSVFASLSVVVQQPSAIARAAALVDTKYFIGPKVDHKRHKALWDEVKQYAPVAIIKEMGYFDTNMGKSTQDFITSKEYNGFTDKMKALVTDSNYRDEMLSKAPALADEIAWCGIWEAVKRETQAKNPGMDVKSEAFLKKAGERFTEVVTKTQVYDSVLSRSGLMRSKDTGMKMATAFMAEPTTSINMIADALLQGKRGNKKYAKAAIGAVIASQILNSILVSFVYAGRDDDEEETYWEKYIGTLSGEILDSLNPASYIPFIKDIVSIVQGYDVERSDMAVVSDLWNAIKNLSKDNMSAYRKVEGFAGSIAQIFGLPVKNIMRDARAIYQTIMSFVNGQQTTAAGIGYAIKGAITGEDVSNQQQLYEAYLSGDSAQIARVESRFKDQNAIYTAMRTAIKAHYEAGELDADTAEQYLVEFGGLEADDAYWKVQEWSYETENDDEFQKYSNFYEAVKTGKNLKAVIKEYTDNGVDSKALASQITSYFKPLYKEMSNVERASIKGYLLNAYALLGYDRSKKSKDIDKWVED